MRIIAIDPGSEKSAWLWYDTAGSVEGRGISDNQWLLNFSRTDAWKQDANLLAIEMVACYGMPVGKEVFETCVWIGRFIEAWDGAWCYVYRLDVKMALCHDSRAKDSNVRRAIIDRFPATGGGAIPQIGTKKKPGPLYGMKKDLWSALAVALTAQEKL